MKFMKIGLVSIFIIASNTGFAGMQTSSAVNKNNCGTMVNTLQPFILVLDRRDDLIASISQCAKDARLLGASVTGIGQVQNPILAYFDRDPTMPPRLTRFRDVYELAAMNGNITNNANEYYTHLHVVLADMKFRTIAGHLNHAIVGMTVEVIITPFPAVVERSVDKKTGFGPIEH